MEAAHCTAADNEQNRHFARFSGRTSLKSERFFSYCFTHFSELIPLDP